MCKPISFFYNLFTRRPFEGRRKFRYLSVVLTLNQHLRTKKTVTMRRPMTHGVAVGGWAAEGAKRAGRGTGVPAGTGACLRALTGGLWRPVSLPNPPKSHW